MWFGLVSSTPATCSRQKHTLAWVPETRTDSESQKKKSEHKPQPEAEPRGTQRLMNNMECLLLSAPDTWELPVTQHHCCKGYQRDSSWGKGLQASTLALLL